MHNTGSSAGSRPSRPRTRMSARAGASQSQHSAANSPAPAPHGFYSQPTTGIAGSARSAAKQPAPSLPQLPPPPPGMAPFPLSARKAPPLDLLSVERRRPARNPLPLGQAAPEPAKTRRHFGLQECPTYRPTTDQFRDPLAYIRTIADEGKRYGIVKIIPPDTWTPPFAIDTERFHFRTRRQELNEVEGSNRESVTYLEALAKFHKQNSNANLHRFPCVDKRPLDLYRLKRLVEEKGGFDAVCKTKRWAEIGRDLGYSGKIMSSLSTSLKNSYQKWIQSFELYIAKNKAALFNRDPTPSPAKTAQKSHPGPAPTTTTATTTIDGLVSQPDQKTESTPDSPLASAASTPGPECAPSFISSGFTAVNHGPRPPLSRSASTNIKGKLEVGRLDPAKRRDHDLPDHQLPTRRSKRIKREACAAGPNSIPAAVRARASVDSHPQSTSQSAAGSTVGDSCEICGKPDGRLRECDGCDSVYHLDCIEEKKRPSDKSEWHCPKCLVGTGDYGFQDGSTYSLRQFQEKAQFFKQSHFSKEREPGEELDLERDSNGLLVVSEDVVEKEFWRLAESLTEPVEVEYGADLHSGIHGSGFPTVERFPEEPYSRDGWNLNNLPLEKASLFRHIKSEIDGMTVPWVYVGMCFSCFCWHAEDHNTYSINYQHFGDTKTWYGIPAHSFDSFERATHELAPELTEKQPDLLYQLVTLFTPDKLRAHGVEVYATDQRAGQFVVTFPQAYHAGFNHGFNLNEAVNFVLDDWEPLGLLGVLRLREFRRAPCFSHDELLLTIAKRDSSVKTARWLAPALEKLRVREMSERTSFRRRHLEVQSGEMQGDDPMGETTVDKPCHRHLDGRAAGPKSTSCGLVELREDDSITDEEYVCAYCNSFTYLSRFYCPKSKKSYCVLHASTTWNCCEEANSSPQNVRQAEEDHILYIRYTEEELLEIETKMFETASTPDKWIEKVRKIATEEGTPQLKTLRSLLTEGEKIHQQWDMSEDLISLRQFVSRCTEWTEAASAFVSRKQCRRKGKERDTEREADGPDCNRSMDELRRLLAEADELAFESSEVGLLRDRALEIVSYQSSVESQIKLLSTSKEILPLLQAGHALGVSGIPEVEILERLVVQLQWWEDVKQATDKSGVLSREKCVSLIEEAQSAGISAEDDSLDVLRRLIAKGDGWQSRAKAVLNVDQMHDSQLETLMRQAVGLPVAEVTLDSISKRLNQQRTARDAIVNLLTASRNPELEQRPHYKDVRAAIDSVADLSAASKPVGTADLERELKRHEDWMRRGKKLFGKANAPLHILLQHMQYVEERNRACLDIKTDILEKNADLSQRLPPNQESNGEHAKAQPGTSKEQSTIFCLCRKPEWGMMVECEICHEWYHGRCLKISRTKLKDDEKFTCPICDYRVQIPRDASRPKLEDCMLWQDEIGSLPFQPEEGPTLRGLVDHAVAFREHLRPFSGPGAQPTVPEMRFFLRKLEGADILLANETNFFRLRLHEAVPVAPAPPQPIAESLSTRKPRPTKQQKMMVQYGVSTPDDLPAHVKLRKRKSNNASNSSNRQQSPSGGHHTNGDSMLEDSSMLGQDAGEDVSMADARSSFLRESEPNRLPVSNGGGTRLSIKAEGMRGEEEGRPTGSGELSGNRMDMPPAPVKGEA